MKYDSLESLSYNGDRHDYNRNHQSGFTIILCRNECPKLLNARLHCQIYVMLLICPQCLIASKSRIKYKGALNPFLTSLLRKTLCYQIILNSFEPLDFHFWIQKAPTDLFASNAWTTARVFFVPHLIESMFLAGSYLSHELLFQLFVEINFNQDEVYFDVSATLLRLYLFGMLFS